MCTTKVATCENESVAQSLNSYSYANGNPITKSDPTGKAVGIDDAAGFIAGGVVGTAIYAGTSAFTGQPMSWGGVGGAFVSGGIGGVGLVNAPETGGLSVAVAYAAVTGGAGGLFGNATKQGIDIATGAQKSELSWRELGGSFATGFVFGGLTEGSVPLARIPVLSSGRNSFYAIGQSAQTRIANGYASSMSFSTASKGAVGSQAANILRNLTAALLDASRTLSTMQAQQKSAAQK
jgi:hypothetical protein